MKELYYLIGEVLKLVNVLIKVFCYYDKIDLFKFVYVDLDINYCYYIDFQFYYFDLIKLLKYIGIFLEEMKKVQELEMEELFVFYIEQEK